MDMEHTEALFSKSVGKQMKWSGNSYNLSRIIKKIFAYLFVNTGIICEEGYAAPTNIKTLLAGTRVPPRKAAGLFCEIDHRANHRHPRKQWKRRF